VVEAIAVAHPLAVDMAPGNCKRVSSKAAEGSQVTRVERFRLGQQGVRRDGVA
jgi:hypothetical protein